MTRTENDRPRDEGQDADPDDGGRGAALEASFEASWAASAAGDPPAGRLFGGGTKAELENLEARLAAMLRRCRAEVAETGHGNAIARLAVQLLRLLADRSVSFAAVEELIRRLTVRSFARRAARTGRYLGETDVAANDRRIRALISALAWSNEAGPIRTGPGRGEAPVPFAEFRARIEAEIFGIVVTAHPTFGLSADLLRILGRLAVGRGENGAQPSPADDARLLEIVARAEHRPDPDLDLLKEHELSLEALGNLQAALRRVYAIVFDVAAEIYPTSAHELTPRLITLASWVGYDLDGRSDITWTDTLHTRLKVQLLQLAHYRDAVLAVLGRVGHQSAARAPLDRMARRMTTAIEEVSDEMEVFGAGTEQPGAESSGYERIRRLAKRMHDGLERRLIETTDLLGAINAALDAVDDDRCRRELNILRAEIANFGLGMAHTHVRMNASQLHNAIRGDIGMTTEADDPAYRRSYRNALNELLATVRPVTINFGSILAEQASAKRLFMVVAQMLKYVDAATPVRFLIAECDTALTLLTALYFARLFGVEDRVDISPLFETEKALDQGARIMAELLENPHYRAYIRRRGRVAVQTGYSDAGRLLGQTAAVAGIDRLKLRLIDLLADHGLTDVQLVVFDTHGEAIGRGGHPAGFADRLDYVMSPASRARHAARGIRFKQETSFQGGDGYVYLMTLEGAYAVIRNILEKTLVRPVGVESDPYYDETDYLGEFFATVAQANAAIVNDPDFGELLGLFGTNLLYAAGSRSLQRQSEDSDDSPKESQALKFRAISHNSILQQLGFLANSLAGVGRAIGKDPERFEALYRKSARFRLVMDMAIWAAGFSDIDALAAYIDLVDPGVWLESAANTPQAERRHDMRVAADFLERLGAHEKLHRVFRAIRHDFIDLSEGLLALKGLAAPAAPQRVRDELALAHALRIALLHQIYLLAARIPDFSAQHGTTKRRLIDQIVHLDVADAVKKLERIFPIVHPFPEDADFGEPATYVAASRQGYDAQHVELFRPMAKLHELARRISAAVIHTIGAIG